MAQQTDKDKGTEQEVFLGVKGNAQASRRCLPSRCRSGWLCCCRNLARPRWEASCCSLI